jgi:hypothetical protein
MTQNTSHAVMSQRHEAHDSLDHFPTPPWATRALCEWLEEGTSGLWKNYSCWEPACAEGHMSRALIPYFREVYSSDVHNYGYGYVEDFLFVTERWADFVITNPPFRLGEQFAFKARLIARVAAAMLVRTAFLESADRYNSLFKSTPPTDILQFVERVPMFKGRLDRHGSTATSYCWLVWRKAAPAGTRFHWLAPCRKRLERDSDYPESLDLVRAAAVGQ